MLLSLVLAAGCVPLFGQDSTAAQLAVPEGQVCGLGKAFHAGRRAALVEAIGAHEGVVLVRGLPDTRAYTRFEQDKTFWYLTGVESPNAALLIDLKSTRAILFLPAASRMKETWEGELWDASDAWVPQLTGIPEVRANTELEQTLSEFAPKGSTVWVSMEPYIELAGCADRARPADAAQAKDAFDGRASREAALKTNLETKFGLVVKDCAAQLAELRRVKTPEEIDALRRAGRSGALAMIEAMRSTKPGVGEWQLDALMSFVQRNEGARGPAYHAIVGSGPNALALHYSASSRVLREKEMLLIDYAPEYDHYDCDITRSWPTDGEWTPRMAEIYDAVLAAQTAGIAAVKPGATMREVEAACRKVLTERGMEKLLPHGCCHYIGMEVHDVGDGGKLFVPGVAFTVEPGVYDPASGIGVRIEDVVVVTETGCEVVSELVPREREAITKLVRSSGMLERDDPELRRLVPGAFSQPRKN
ncbi:MAG: aminopeptidase P family protein [Planctomycetes bacterium]|nr:aminopeptidase P family protein [Planctomycetota bacterium]